MQDIKKIIEGLREEIRNHDYLYYVLSQPDISDKEYDSLISKLKKLEDKFPKFKSKHDEKHSFRLTGALHVEARRIKLPNIGWVKLKERDYIPQDAHILSATVSTRAQRWFVSVLTEEEVTPETNLKGNVVGVDLGVADRRWASDLSASRTAAAPADVRLCARTGRFAMAVPERHPGAPEA